MFKKLLLTAISLLVKAEEAEEKSFEPAFRWAQSWSDVFLEVKFAANIEKKSCVNLAEEEYTLSEDRTSLFIKARCVDDKKLYKLSLPLYEGVRPTTHSEEEIEMLAGYEEYVVKEEQR